MELLLEFSIAIGLESQFTLICLFLTIQLILQGILTAQSSA